MTITTIIIIRPRLDCQALSPEPMISLVLRPLGRWVWQRSKRSCHFCANSYLVLENQRMQYGNDQNEISIKPSPWCLHWLPPLFRSVQNCLISPSPPSSSPYPPSSPPSPPPSSSPSSPYSSPTMTSGKKIVSYHHFCDLHHSHCDFHTKFKESTYMPPCFYPDQTA